MKYSEILEMQEGNCKYSIHSLSPDLNVGNEYKSAGGFGDCNDESLICNVPTPLPVSSAASILTFNQTLDKHSLYDDQSIWNKTDYETNINMLANQSDNQKQYLKLQEEKYARNKALIAHLKNLLQKEAEEYTRKETEIARLSKEHKKYENQISLNAELCSKSKHRFSVEETLNKELKKKKTRLEVENKSQKQEAAGRADDVNAPKRLTDRERLQQMRNRINDSGKMLEQDLQLNLQLNIEERNTVSLPQIKTGHGHFLDKAVEEKSPKRVAAVLPDINKGNSKLIGQKIDQCHVHARSNANKNLLHKVGLQKVHAPQPPSGQTKNVKRYNRKYKVDGY